MTRSTLTPGDAKERLHEARIVGEAMLIAGLRYVHPKADTLEHLEENAIGLLRGIVAVLDHEGFDATGAFLEAIEEVQDWHRAARVN